MLGSNMLRMESVRELHYNRCMGSVLTEYMRSIAEEKRHAGSVFKRLSHNSKSQQKEARTGRYIEKQASNFVKYLIMGQALKCGVW
uniref:Uncharacterized protein n=1 Tax=Candidatus Methanogaster sp. ANME-2c ERB4 TaxID=2759911 RepID=A0A7G9YJJ3_9EURY|nr:hypothetical protein KNONPEEI_00033 [Methanosarcinales archaeon ANME-2c ERB4]QNO48177.1 hypothetical protein GOJLPIDM_00034 [Methanosarcinales archaeon ANME-2c ERB4]